MVANILGAKKHTIGQRLEKHTGLNQTGDWFQAKSADSVHLLANFTELRNALLVERQALQTMQIFGTRMLLLSRKESLPNGLPDSMFVGCVRSRRNGFTRLVAHGDLSNSITTRAILRIPKAGMVRVKLNNGISV